MAGGKEFGQDAVEQFEFTRRSHDLLVNGIVGRRKVLVDFGEDVRVVTDLSELHQGVLQRGLFSGFAIGGVSFRPVAFVNG